MLLFAVNANSTHILSNSGDSFPSLSLRVGSNANFPVMGQIKVYRIFILSVKTQEEQLLKRETKELQSSVYGMTTLLY